MNHSIYNTLSSNLFPDSVTSVLSQGDKRKTAKGLIPNIIPCRAPRKKNFEHLDGKEKSLPHRRDNVKESVSDNTVLESRKSLNHAGLASLQSGDTFRHKKCMRNKVLAAASHSSLCNTNSKNNLKFSQNNNNLGPVEISAQFSTFIAYKFSVISPNLSRHIVQRTFEFVDEASMISSRGQSLKRLKTDICLCCGTVLVPGRTCKTSLIPLNSSTRRKRETKRYTKNSKSLSSASSLSPGKIVFSLIVTKCYACGHRTTVPGEVSPKAVSETIKKSHFTVKSLPSYLPMINQKSLNTDIKKKRKKSGSLIDKLKAELNK